MNKLGGQYLHPITFVSDTLSNGDFREKVWKEDRMSWGEIAFQYNHTSYPPISAFKSTGFTSVIYISTDGLIALELMSKIESDEEALILLSHHLNSFLGIINLGGIFFFSFSEKEMSHIELKNKLISQISGGGDQYSQAKLKRAKLRLKSQTPYVTGTSIIGFDWVGMRINKKNEINKALKLGKKIIGSHFFRKDSQILALEAYKEYTLHKWNNALLLSWTFIEILLDEL